MQNKYIYGIQIVNTNQLNLLEQTTSNLDLRAVTNRIDGIRLCNCQRVMAPTGATAPAAATVVVMVVVVVVLEEKQEEQEEREVD